MNGKVYLQLTSTKLIRITDNSRLITTPIPKQYFMLHMNKISSYLQTNFPYKLA
jgi:hypothetical protein